MSNQENNLQDIITQLISLNLYMLKTQGEKDLAGAQASIGAAIEHCRKNDGIEPKLLLEMFENAFPGHPLPKILTSEDLEELLKHR